MRSALAFCLTLALSLLGAPASAQPDPAGTLVDHLALHKSTLWKHATNCNSVAALGVPSGPPATVTNPGGSTGPAWIYLGIKEAELCFEEDADRLWVRAGLNWHPLAGFVAIADETIAALEPVRVASDGGGASSHLAGVKRATGTESDVGGYPAVGIALNAASASSSVIVATTGFRIDDIDTDEPGSAVGEPVCVGTTGGFAWGWAACHATATNQMVATVQTKHATTGRLFVSIGSQHPPRNRVWRSADCSTFDPGVTTSAFLGDLCIENDRSESYVCNTATCAGAGWLRFAVGP
jgi:hypothetical protein